MDREKNKKSIAIVYEIEHVEAVIAHFGIRRLKNDDTLTIVPIDYEVEYKLKSAGIPFFSMSDYEPRSSLKDRAMFVSKIAKDFRDGPEMDFFEFNGIKLCKIIGYSLDEYLLRVLYYLDIFNFLINKFKHVDLVYIPESTKIALNTAGQLAEFEIVLPLKTAMFLARERGIETKVIPRSHNIVVKKKLNTLIRYCKRAVYIWLIKIINFGISMFGKRGAMRILVSDYWWHIDSFITNMSGVELTMVERKEIQNARKNVWKYKIRFNHPSDYVTLFAKRRAEECRQRYEKLWRSGIGSRGFSKNFVWQGVNFWEIVAPAYNFLISFFSGRVVETIIGSERLIKKQRINAVILRASVSGQIHFAVLGLVARSLGIPAVELQHGLEYSTEFSISVRKSAEFLASYGPIIKRELERFNGKPFQALNIGSPRFDQYMNEIISERAKSSLRKKLNIDDSRPVLLYVATDIVLGQTHDTYSMHRLFQKLAESTRGIDKLQIIVKIRPGPSREYFFRESLRESFGGRCHVSQYENIHELISVSDIIVSSFSTVTLEAMIAGKPLILSGLDRNDLILFESHFLPYEKDGCAIIARNENDLATGIKKLLNPSFAEAMTRKANVFLKKNFCFDGRSAERMAKFLEKLRQAHPYKGGAAI